MITRNGTSFTFDPEQEHMMTVLMAWRGVDAKSIDIRYGCEEAADQFEDILNKFTCLPSEYKTLIWKHMGNFIRSNGFKIVEDGGVVPQ